MSWYSINTIDGVAHAGIRDEIGAFGQKAEAFEEALGTPEKVFVCIDSNGGDGWTGVRLHEILSRFETEVLITGNCASASVAIAMAGRKIEILRGREMMVHSSRSYAYGTEQVLLDAMKGIAEANEKAIQIICKRTKLPEELVRGWHSDGKDHYLKAEECLALRLVDSIVDPQVKPTVQASISNAPTAQASICEARPTIKPDTEKQKLFEAWLKVFADGGLEVADKNQFGQKLYQWFQLHVRE